MVKTVVIREFGGPEAMTLENMPLGRPGPGEARVRHTAIGLNFIDIYNRNGLYPQPLPGYLGKEGAGVIEELGDGVADLAVGDRVAYCGGPLGSYSEGRVMPASELVRLPDGVADADAASVMLKGLTVQYLFRQTKCLEPGETVLFHGVAGAVGLIACQWARALGVRLIGTVSTDEKAALAKEAGCEHIIIHSRENFVERVKDLTDGKGVSVVYDGVGKDTFPASLDCIQLRGLWVSFGNSSGPVPSFAPLLLMQKGSLFATRPNLAAYAHDRASLLAMSAELFAMLDSGKIKAAPRNLFALADVVEAHRAMESRRLSGASVLVP